MRTVLLSALFLLLAGKSCASEDNNVDERLSRESLLYGIVVDVQERRAGGEDVDGEECGQRLEMVKEGVDRGEVWALKMVDSSGSAGSGFLWGNNYWLGSLEECRDLENRSPLPVSSSLGESLKSWPLFPVEFYVATFRHNSTLQVHVGVQNEDLLSVGLCLPDVCTAVQIENILKIVISKNILSAQRLYKFDLSLEQVRSLRRDYAWLLHPKFIAIASVVLALLLTVLVATFYDILIWQPSLRVLQFDGFNNNNVRENKISKVRSQGRFSQLLLCFSICANTNILFNMKLGPDSISAIHGLRFISMCWILIVHSIYYMADSADNKPFAFRLSDDFWAQIVSNSSLSTDTFFVLSGFLLSLMFFKAKGFEKRAFSLRTLATDLFNMMTKRFLRLTPAYMMVLGILIVNMSWRNRTSVFHMTERADIVCSKYWWRNALYVNNLFPRDEMCMSWSWFLSNDMQFFFVGSFLLVLSTSFKILSAILLLVMLIGSSLLTGYISYSHNHIPTIDQQFALLEVLYDPPWVRIGPYLVGIITGYLVARLDGKLLLGKTTVALLWIAAALFEIGALFGIYNRDISVLAAAIYVGSSRTVWGIGLSWIIVACSTNNAGFINTILSFPIWIPLSRLTYCVYLLNPLLISSVHLGSEVPVHFGFLSITTQYFGFVGMSYLCAYGVSLLVETPSIRLIKQLTDIKSKTLS